MREELQYLHDRLKLTFVYVTHDLYEAMTLADRIAIMKDGKIMQVATPQELYDKPDNVYVATFMGQPQMNIFKMKLEGNTLSAQDMNITLDKTYEEYDGRDVYVGIRPEAMFPVNENYEGNKIFGYVRHSEIIGGDTIVHLRNNIADYSVKYPEQYKFPIGTKHYSGVKSEKIYLFDPATDKAIY